MFNNRMLAVAAVLVMAVPALGAATPIVVPPVPEQLVEGHTVFTVIEIVAATQTNETRFAAAVAVLVREYQADRSAQRFPGVLWFNDQYLVNPYQNDNEAAAFRYPCGGAVMAVNSGDPDPRMVIARIGLGTPAITTGVVDEPASSLGSIVVGPDSYDYTFEDGWVKPDPNGDDSSIGGTPGNGVWEGQYDNDYAWIGADPSQNGVDVSDPTNPTLSGRLLYSDSVLGVLTDRQNEEGDYEYEESYLITDPNDHSWIIDKYNFYTRDEVFGTDLDNGLVFTTTTEIYSYPVWVVNTLGSPVFVPDNGIALNIGEFVGENCVPFKDTIEEVLAPLRGTLCGLALQDVEYLDSGNDTDITLSQADDGVPPWTDDPCMSYEEPSRNGYCYGGQSAADGCYQGPTGNCNFNSHYDGEGPMRLPGDPHRCTQDDSYVNTPLRQYNALLYFKLEDLTVAGLARDHCGFDPTLNGGAGGCNPALVADTNGCSAEQYPWGPNPPQAAYDWPCPTYDPATGYGGNDDMEGNSHPFHPTAPPHEEAELCGPAFDGPNPGNHGGSTYADVGQPTIDGWYQEAMPCDYLHATRNIDIYFSPGGRPFPPVLRVWDVVDLEGSSAPFQDFHSSYPGVS